MERLTEKFRNSDGTGISKRSLVIEQGIRKGMPSGFCSAIVTKCADYEDAEEHGLLIRLPCKVGDMVYVDSKTVPTANMDFEEVKEIPLYFRAEVVSYRKNSNGSYIKLKVRAKWLHEWFDPDCGPDSAYFDTEKYFTYPSSAIGRTVFLTQSEAEEALKKMNGTEE